MREKNSEIETQREFLAEKHAHINNNQNKTVSDRIDLGEWLKITSINKYTRISMAYRWQSRSNASTKFDWSTALWELELMSLSMKLRVAANKHDIRMRSCITLVWMNFFTCHLAAWQNYQCIDAASERERERKSKLNDDKGNKMWIQKVQNKTQKRPPKSSAKAQYILQKQYSPTKSYGVLCSDPLLN